MTGSATRISVSVARRSTASRGTVERCLAASAMMKRTCSAASATRRNITGWTILARRSWVEDVSEGRISATRRAKASRTEMFSSSVRPCNTENGARVFATTLALTRGSSSLERKANTSCGVVALRASIARVAGSLSRAKRSIFSMVPLMRPSPCLAQAWVGDLGSSRMRGFHNWEA